MAEFKIVLGFPEGRCTQREVKDPQASSLIGKKIGDKIDGSLIGLEGYELQITGGSDIAGFPMRRDVLGTMRKKILDVEGVGIHKIGKGVRQRKTVAGNTIHNKVVQINLKVLKIGKENVLPPPKEKKEEAKAAAKPEEIKPEKAEPAETPIIKSKVAEPKQAEKPKDEKVTQQQAADHKPKEEKKAPKPAAAEKNKPEQKPGLQPDIKQAS